MSGENGELRYRISFAPDGGQPDQAQVAAFEQGLRALARTSFGDEVVVAGGAPDTCEAAEPDTVGWTAELLRPEVQAKLDQRIDAVLSGENLGISSDSPRAERGVHTRILNALRRDGIDTVRKAFIVGDSLQDVRNLSDGSLRALQAWLHAQVPEMPLLVIDAPMPPEYVALFCSDLSQIPAPLVPAQRSFSSIGPPDIDLATYKYKYIDGGYAFNHDSHREIQEYVERFEQARQSIEAGRREYREY